MPGGNERQNETRWKTLQEANGSIARTGEKLGVSRQSLNVKLKKYNFPQ